MPYFPAISAQRSGRGWLPTICAGSATPAWMRPRMSASAMCPVPTKPNVPSIFMAVPALRGAAILTATAGRESALRQQPLRLAPHVGGVVGDAVEVRGPGQDGASPRALALALEGQPQEIEDPRILLARLLQLRHRRRVAL